jgi:hypothetical protein
MSISRVICPIAFLLVLAIGHRISADSDEILKSRFSIEIQTSTPVNYLALLLRESGGWPRLRRSGGIDLRGWPMFRQKRGGFALRSNQAMKLMAINGMPRPEHDE